MTKVIKLTDRIPRVDINHYLSASDEESRVCVFSERDVTVIRSYLFPGVEWPTRFVRPLGGDNYETGTEGEFSEYLEELNELDYRLSGGLTMSLETALGSIADAIEALATAQSSTSLNNIVRAIATSNACCEQQIINQGGGVIGSTEQPVGGNDVPIFGTQDPVSVPVETYPDGYTSLEEYRLDKCQISNLIIDGIVGTLRNLGAFGVFNGIALAGLIVTAIVGIIIFPPAFVPIAAACIGFLSVEVTLLTLAANYIEDNREEWVCAIYNSDGTEAAIAVLADLIDALIASIGASGGAAFWVKQILLLLFNADTINQAMQKTAHITYPDADCSGCQVNCVGSDLTQWTIVDGTGLIVAENTLRVQPVLIYSYYYVDLLLSIPIAEYTSLTFSVSSSSAIQFNIVAYLYSEGTPYPGQYTGTVGQNQTPPVNINLELPAVGEVAELYLAIRPTATNTPYDWFEISDLCLS